MQYGQLRFRDTVFEGSFHQSLPHGQGKFSDKGIVLSGMWQHGESMAVEAEVMQVRVAKNPELDEEEKKRAAKKRGKKEGVFEALSPCYTLDQTIMDQNDGALIIVNMDFYFSSEEVMALSGAKLVLEPPRPSFMSLMMGSLFPCMYLCITNKSGIVREGETGRKIKITLESLKPGAKLGFCSCPRPEDKEDVEFFCEGTCASEDDEDHCTIICEFVGGVVLVRDLAIASWSVPTGLVTLNFTDLTPSETQGTKPLVSAFFAPLRTAPVYIQLTPVTRRTIVRAPPKRGSAKKR